MNSVVLFLILAVIAVLIFQVTMYVLVPLAQQKRHTSSQGSEYTDFPGAPE
jgi:hypothetical protein